MKGPVVVCVDRCGCCLGGGGWSVKIVLGWFIKCFHVCIFSCFHVSSVWESGIDLVVSLYDSAYNYTSIACREQRSEQIFLRWVAVVTCIFARVSKTSHTQNPKQHPTGDCTNTDGLLAPYTKHKRTAMHVQKMHIYNSCNYYSHWCIFNKYILLIFEICIVSSLSSVTEDREVVEDFTPLSFFFHLWL